MQGRGAYPGVVFSVAFVVAGGFTMERAARARLVGRRGRKHRREEGDIFIFGALLGYFDDDDDISGWGENETLEIWKESFISCIPYSEKPTLHFAIPPFHA